MVVETSFCVKLLGCVPPYGMLHRASSLLRPLSNYVTEACFKVQSKMSPCAETIISCSVAINVLIRQR